MKTITGLPSSEAELDALLKVLKQLCGAGGTRLDRALELQGDHRTRVQALGGAGFTVETVDMAAGRAGHRHRGERAHDYVGVEVAASRGSPRRDPESTLALLGDRDPHAHLRRRAAGVLVVGAADCRGNKRQSRAVGSK